MVRIWGRQMEPRRLGKRSPVYKPQFAGWAFRQLLGARQVWMLRYNLRYHLFPAISDALLVIFALALSSLLRIRIDLGADAAWQAFVSPPLLYPIAVVIWLFSFGQTHVYAAHSAMSFGRIVRRLLTGH